MKGIKYNLTIYTIFLFINTTLAQSGNFESINKAISEVQTESKTFRQELKTVDVDGRVMMTIGEISRKGKSTTSVYEFNLRDISKENLRYKISKDVINIGIQIEEGLPFIKLSQDGEFKKYTDNFDFYCRDYDAVKSALEILSKAISEVREVTPQNSPPENFGELKSWLTANVSKINSLESLIEQSIAFDDTNDLIATYIVNRVSSKGRVQEKYDFNLVDISAERPDIKANGDYFTIEFITYSKNKYVSVQEDGEAQKNSDALKILVETPEKVRLVSDAFVKLSVLSKDMFKSTLPDLEDFNNSAAYLKEAFELEIGENCDTKITQSSPEEKTEWIANFSDLDEYSPELKVDGNEYVVSVKAKNKLDYISLIENGVFEKYTNSLSISNTNLQKVRLADEAFRKVIKECQTKFKLDVPSGKPEVLSEWLQKNIPNFKNVDSEITQKLTIKDENPCVWTFKKTTTEKGKAEELVYEIKPYSFDTFASTIKVNRQNVYVELVTKGKEKIINVIENGKPGSFENSVSFQIDDIAKAKEIYEVFRSAINGCK